MYCIQTVIYYILRSYVYLILFVICMVCFYRKFLSVLMGLRKLNWEFQQYVFVSYSMEECEALCTRLAIMVKGQFQMSRLSTAHQKQVSGLSFCILCFLLPIIFHGSLTSPFVFHTYCCSRAWYLLQTLHNFVHGDKIISVHLTGLVKDSQWRCT